jgi:hypothetical protein
MKKALVVFMLFVSVQLQANTDPKVGVTKLKELLLAQGAPKIEGKVQVNDKEVPQLKFGDKSVALNYKVVDTVKKELGCTATVFVRSGDEYVRISTNVLNPDGTRAIGTQLARNAAYESINQGKMFCGDVDILGSPYSTCYEPLKIGDKVEGIYYFGCKK